MHQDVSSFSARLESHSYCGRGLVAANRLYEIENVVEKPRPSRN
jgi:hypothetical protein